MPFQLRACRQGGGARFLRVLLNSIDYMPLRSRRPGRGTIFMGSPGHCGPCYENSPLRPCQKLGSAPPVATTKKQSQPGQAPLLVIVTVSGWAARSVLLRWRWERGPLWNALGRWKYTRITSQSDRLRIFSHVFRRYEMLSQSAGRVS